MALGRQPLVILGYYSGYCWCPLFSTHPTTYSGGSGKPKCADPLFHLDRWVDLYLTNTLIAYRLAISGLILAIALAVRFATKGQLVPNGITGAMEMLDRSTVQYD